MNFSESYHIHRDQFPNSSGKPIEIERNYYMPISVTVTHYGTEWPATQDEPASSEITDTVVVVEIDGSHEDADIPDDLRDAVLKFFDIVEGES